MFKSFEVEMFDSGTAGDKKYCNTLSVNLFISSLQPKRMDRFRRKFPQMILQKFASFFFFAFFFFNFENDDVMAANLNFFAFFKSSTLTVAFMLWFFSKLLTKKKNCVPVFDIKNKLNQFITLVSMANHVFEVY